MSEQSFGPDPLEELREIATAAEKLAGGHGGSGWEAIEIGF